jgi:hypothetical protein
MPEHVVSIQVSICLGLKIKEKSLNLKFKPNQTYISFKHYNYPMRYYWSIVATTVTLGVSQSPPPLQKKSWLKIWKENIPLQKSGWRERTIAHSLTKHGILSQSFFHRCKQSGLVRVFLVQLGFHWTPTLKCTIMNLKWIFQSESLIEGVCTVLALIERGRRVSFGEAWHFLGVDGVRTYVIWCKNINRTW